MDLKRKWLERDSERILLAGYPLLILLATLTSGPYANLLAGVRCGALWSVRVKHWWLLAVIEWSVVGGLWRYRGNFPASLPEWMDLFAPFVMFGIAHVMVFFFIRPSTAIDSMRALIGRLFAAVIAVGLASFAFVNLRNLADDRNMQGFAVALFEDRVGTGLGMISIGLLIVTFAQRKFLAGRDFTTRTVGVAILPACMLFSLMQIDPSDAHVDPVMISILPLLVVSHYYGVRIAVLAFNVFAACALLQHGELPEFWQSGRVETFLTILGFGVVVIGGSSDLTRLQHENLTHSVAAETERSSKMSDVALRLTHQEEKDRQRIAQDLHDQLGQDLTAIATYVQIASKRTEDLGTLQYLKTVSSLVDDAHWHLRAINDKLHPIALSRFGLTRALESGPVIELLTEQGFEYDFRSTEVDRHLPEKIEIALYRICQEAITNAIKHGKNRWLSVTLAQHTISPDRAQLDLRILDDEGEIDASNSTGYGLQGIRDRAHSIGASCEFNAENGTPRFHLTVEFEPVKAQA
ncbi:hypothetical protein G7069_09220 [Lysobacter sp. HDW10]|uniref:histidine kinase n=1 Tax=Lysobacter sp. HDW10 TaxID=2714936 RepID=UPI0014091B87|nr:histidine kinase [Lysobacter sp. HDW10]QIK81758.1 hypothetical protein G7069_09220 [Lysobacter sp. HDW10]